MSEAWSTEEIREAFVYDGGEAEYYDPSMSEHDHARAFDRWLAAYTAEKQAEALEQFADDLLPGESGLMRVADVIRIARDAAQRLRGQATNQQDGGQ